jgi:2-succinyl-6-hydroxy-2,4-cyclohexadiene-1-carboxylate synthase
VTRVAISGDFALNVEIAGSGEPLVLLHGFTGSAQSWGEFAEMLSACRTTIAVDVVGHGASDSPGSLEHYVMAQCAADLVDAVRLVGFPRAAWLGYSMGARTALRVANSFPAAVSCLVLIGGSPGIECVEERIARRSADDLLAARIEREGIPAFVEYWQALPLFATQASLPAATRASVRAGRLANTPVGLANSLRGMGTGAQEPLHDELPRLGMSTLVLAGALDRKFVEIGESMAAVLPFAEFDTIAEAGHAAQLEQPRRTGERVVQFLQRPALAPPSGVS